MEAPGTRRGTRGPRDLLFTALGVGLLSLGVLSTYLASQRMGVDFAQFHLMGQAIAQGENVYSDAHLRALYPQRYGFGAPIGLFYPPSTGFAMLPFGLLPYPLAKVLWFVASLAVLVLGIRALIRLVRPESRAHVWMITGGVVLLSATIRWGMTPLQAAPLVLGLLCFFVVAVVEDRKAMVFAIAAFVMAFKLTMALPFLGVLILRRWFGAAALVVALWLVLNVAGFARLGAGAFADYRYEMTLVEGIADINSPDPWYSRSIPRTDWVYLFYGLTANLQLARVLSAVITIAVASWLAWCFLRVRQPVSVITTGMFLGALIGLGSLCVYHHQYDLALFIAPLILWWFSPERRAPPVAVALILPLVAVLAIFPVAVANRVFTSLIGAHAIGILNMMFPVVVSLGLIAFLIMMPRLESMPVRGEALSRRS